MEIPAALLALLVLSATLIWALTSADTASAAAPAAAAPHFARVAALSSTSFPNLPSACLPWSSADTSGETSPPITAATLGAAPAMISPRRIRLCKSAQLQPCSSSQTGRACCLQSVFFLPQSTRTQWGAMPRTLADLAPIPSRLGTLFCRGFLLRRCNRLQLPRLVRLCTNSGRLERHV